MGSLGFGAGDAASLVVSRFNSGMNKAEAGFNDAYGLIGTIIDVAKSLAVMNMSAISTVDFTDIPPDVPNINLLDIGKNGLPTNVVQAMWEMGLDQAKQLLEDRIDLACMQWAKTGWNRPNGRLARMLTAEFDKFDDDRRSKSMDIADRSHALAADFARTIATLVAQWSMGTIRLNQELGLGQADLRLKQAEIAINQLMERMRLEETAIKGAAQVATELVSAAFVGTSASASIHAGQTSSDSTRTGVSVVNSTVHAEETATKHDEKTVQHRQVDPDFVRGGSYSEDSDSTTESNDHATSDENSVGTSSSVSTSDSSGSST